MTIPMIKTDQIKSPRHIRAMNIISSNVVVDIPTHYNIYIN